LLPKVKEQMARGDLAEAMIRLGDPSAFDVLLAGLQSKDDHERNNAAETLDHVADKLPASRKAEFAAAVEYGKENDKSRTYTQWDKILGKLK
jgi:HEAT repeat protein